MKFTLYCIIILLLFLAPCLSTVCQKNEHQVPLTIYASSESPIHATSFSIVDMYSVLDIAYYNSEDKLMDKTEYSETVCVLESEQMAYRLIVNVAEVLDSDLEIAVFSGYGTELSSMRIKIHVKKDQTPTVIKGPFTLPHVVCTNGRQYSLFKHNTVFANQEFVYVWGTLPNSSTQKLLLSMPTSSNYISFMVDVCIPNTMTNLQLMLKSTGGMTWSEGSYVTVFDSITSSILISTTLTQVDTLTLPFPVGIPTIPLDIQLIVPTSTDRRLIAVWGRINDVETMIAIMYHPFPYYQHMMKCVHVIKNDLDAYSLHFINLYGETASSALELTVTSRERVVGKFFLQETEQTIFSFSAAIRCPVDSYKGIQFPETAIDTDYVTYCSNGTIAYTRHCNSLGNWELPSGSGCFCKAEVDEFGIEWRQVTGGAIVQRACGVGKAGTVHRICSPDGEWKIDSSDCTPLTCPKVTSNDLVWKKTAAGEVASIPCEEGNNQLTRRCNENGEWDSTIEGKCTCHDIMESGLFWNHTSSNTIRQYSCGEGYTGSISRKCSQKGRWLEIRNQCYRIKCDELVEKGVVYPKTYSGNSVMIPCPLPYTGSIHRICQYDGKWGYVFDNCRPPSCEGFLISRDPHGCIEVDVQNRQVDEIVAVRLLPKPSGLDSSFNMLLPGTICDLDVNEPYSILLHRVDAKNSSVTCKVDSIYYKQQCETMITPILREINQDEENEDVIGFRIMVEVPFCYDLFIHSLQVRIDYTDENGMDKPLILTHICHTPCLPGSLIIVSSQTSLPANRSFSITTRAVPGHSVLAIPSQWSDELTFRVNPSKEIFKPVMTVIPKSSHSVRLTWSLDPNMQRLAINNFFIHVYISTQNEHTMDPRYLQYSESHTICNGNDLCRRNSILIPCENKGWRYVFILETSYVHASNILIKNTTVAYVVPEKPMVNTTVTNYDTFANITFYNSNMDVRLNCSVLDSHKMSVSDFTIVMDYGEQVSQILGDLIPSTSYTVVCLIRDDFSLHYSFSIDLRMIDYVPVLPIVNVSRSFFNYADVSFSVNRQGAFKCLAVHVYSEEVLAQIGLHFIEEYGQVVHYSRPFNIIHELIPVHSFQADGLHVSFRHSNVYVACYFLDYTAKESVKIIHVQGEVPTEENALEVVSYVPPPGYDGVYSHATLILVFATEFDLKISDDYYFIVEPIEQLGASFPYKSKEFVNACQYEGMENEPICEGSKSTFSYEPLIVYSWELVQNKTKLSIPLPQLDSNIHYGIRPSLPDMIVDARSSQSFNQSTLFYGKYITHFTSKASLPLIYHKLLQPTSQTQMPLDEDIVIFFSSTGFIPSSHPFKFQRIFGDVLMEEPLNRECSLFEISETGTRITLLISKCIGHLDPSTNYELIIPSQSWSRSRKDSPNTLHYIFRTISKNSPPVLYAVDPLPNAMITRNQSIHFQFNEPVNIGDGYLTISVVDMLTQSIVFEEVKAKSFTLLTQEANAFIISLPIQNIPFYPYALYQISWDNDTFMSCQSVPVAANTTSFYSVDETCNLVAPKQSVFPYFCTYYYDKSIPICRCSELF